MTSEYTTYGCPACGEQHQAGSPGEICPSLRKALLRVNGYVPVDEKRVREIAQEEARREAKDVLGENAEAVREIAREGRDEHWRSMWAQVEDRVREIVLEEIGAHIARTEPIAHYFTVGGNTQPAAQASAEKLVLHPDGCIARIAALEKERDCWRTKALALEEGRAADDREYAATHTCHLRPMTAEERAVVEAVLRCPMDYAEFAHAAEALRAERKEGK